MKRLSFYLILLIILVLSSGVSAQKEIKGMIIDNENRRAYADFDISLKNSTQKTKTNSFGYFRFLAEDSLMKLQFEISPGYVIQSEEMNKNGHYVIRIAPISTEELHILPLEDILNIPVISALKHEEKVENIPASVEVITREEINRMGYLSLQEILNSITGFYTWDDYHVRGRINVGLRGSMSSDNIIILVNGVNQVENMYNEYLLPKVGVPVEAIERIEIIKGPMSVQYGSGAFFGVINIITESPKTGGTARLSGLLGTQGSESGVLDYHQKQKDFSLAATIHGFKSHGMDRPYSSMMSDPSKLTGYGLPLDASTKGILHEERAYMHLSTAYKGFEADFAHSFVERGGFLVQPPVSYSPMNRSSTNAMFSYKKEFSDKFWIQPKFSFLSTNSFATYFLKEEESFFTFGYNSEALESELFAYLKLGESLELTSDISFNSVFYALNPAELEAAWGKPFGHHITRLAIHSAINTYAAFFQGSYRINEHWRVLAGLRFEQMSQFMMESAGGDLLIS